MADEAPTQFWEHFSDAIKKENPEALLLGETWADAHRLLAPDRLDSAMNYLFRDAAADWLAKDRISPAEARSPAQPDALALSVGNGAAAL